MMASVKPARVRSGTAAGDAYIQNIGDLRHEIDSIDSAIICLIAQRADITKRILGIKRTLGMPRHSPEREQQIMSRINALAIEHGISAKTAEQIFTLILRQYVDIGD